MTALKEIERVKATFVNMVLHELRAPLCAVGGYLDIMLEGLARNDPEKERKMLARMRARTEGLLTLVDDLLTVSRLDQAHVSRTIAPVALPELLSETVQLLGADADAHRVRLDYPRGATAAAPLTVMGNREELQQLLTNLLSNAIKYDRPGGSVTVKLDTVGEHVRVAVSDTGLGIPAEAIPNLGREFYRVKTPETREIVGTGLGLSVVKRILAAHHGRLEIASVEGQGSTFTALLPMLGGAAEKAATAGSVSSPSVGLALPTS